MYNFYISHFFASAFCFSSFLAMTESKYEQNQTFLGLVCCDTQLDFLYVLFPRVIVQKRVENIMQFLCIHMVTLPLSHLIVFVITMFINHIVTRTLIPSSIPTHLHLPVFYCHENMIHMFVNNLSLVNIIQLKR